MSLRVNKNKNTNTRSEMTINLDSDDYSYDSYGERDGYRNGYERCQSPKKPSSVHSTAPTEPASPPCTPPCTPFMPFTPFSTMASVDATFDDLSVLERELVQLARVTNLTSALIVYLQRQFVNMRDGAGSIIDVAGSIIDGAGSIIDGAGSILSRITRLKDYDDLGSSVSARYESDQMIKPPPELMAPSVASPANPDTTHAPSVAASSVVTTSSVMSDSSLQAAVPPGFWMQQFRFVCMVMMAIVFVKVAVHLRMSVINRLADVIVELIFNYIEASVKLIIRLSQILDEPHHAMHAAYHPSNQYAMQL